MIQRANTNIHSLENEPPGARGAGELVSVGAALTAAGITQATTIAPRVPVEAMTIKQALASSEPAAGPLLLEAQGQMDITLARACVRKLVARMAADGRP